MKRSIGRYFDIARNVALDLRYGAYLSRPVESRYDYLGAYGVGHTDYRVLAAIFRGRIGPDDVLVDVGCGGGRVINYWLSRGLKNRMIGLELDPEIATRVKARLRRFPNVRIVVGDAAEHLPSAATLLYLFNPFNADVMARFKRAVGERCPRATLLYYNPSHVEVFHDDPEWLVEEVDLALQLPRRYVTSSVVLPFAVVRPADRP